MLSDRCPVLSCSVWPVCNVGALWPNGWMDHAGRPRPWLHCVTWGLSSPIPKGHSPKFSAHICCIKMAVWVKMPLGMEVGLGPGDFVFMGSRSPPQTGAEPPPQLSAHLCCGKTAGYIKRPLRKEVGLSPGDFVLHGDPASSQKGAESPNFRPLFIVDKRLNGSRWHLAWR